MSRLLRLLAEAEGGEAGQSQGREGEAAEGCGGGRGGGRGRLGATGAAHTVNLSRKIISPKQIFMMTSYHYQAGIHFGEHLRDQLSS